MSSSASNEGAQAAAPPTAAVDVVPTELVQGFVLPDESLDYTTKFKGSVQDALNAISSGQVKIPKEGVYLRSARLSLERGFDVYFKLELVSKPVARVHARTQPSARDADGWERAPTVDPETGREYFVNHDLQCTSWCTRGTLPAGFTTAVDEQGRMVFLHNGKSQFADPRLGQASPSQPPPAYRPRVRIKGAAGAHIIHTDHAHSNYPNPPQHWQPAQARVRVHGTPIPASTSSAATPAAVAAPRLRVHAYPANGVAGPTAEATSKSAPPPTVPRVRVHANIADINHHPIDGEAPPVYAEVVSGESTNQSTPSEQRALQNRRGVRLSSSSPTDWSSFTIPEMTEEEMIARAELESLETYRCGSMREMSVKIRESWEESLSQELASPDAPSGGHGSLRDGAVVSAPRRKIDLEKAGLENMAKIWMEQSADSGLPIDPALYARYQQQSSDDDEQIRRDIGRTFAEVSVFQSEEGQERLFRVLHAFSCACSDPACINNEELGYVQGMNFLAGFLIIMCGNEEADEEAAFWLLVRLMMSRKYRVAGMFMEGMSGVFCAAEQVERGMEKLIPKVKKALDAAMIPTTAWLPQWILTLFAKQMALIKPAAVQKIWNNIFKEGWPAIIKTSLAILEASSEYIIGGAFDTLLMYLMEDVWTTVDFFTVAFRASEMKLSRSLLEKAELAYVIRHDQEEREARARLEQRNQVLAQAEIAAAEEPSPSSPSSKKRGPNTIDTIIGTLRQGIAGIVGSGGSKTTTSPKKDANIPTANSNSTDEWEDVADEVPSAIAADAASSIVDATAPAGCRVSLQAESRQMENYLLGKRVKFCSGNGRVLQTSLLGTASFSRSINNWSTWEIERPADGSDGVFLRNKAAGNWLAVDASRMRPCCRMLQARAEAFRIRINCDGRVSLESARHRGFFLASTTDASAVLSSAHNVAILLEVTVIKG